MSRSTKNKNTVTSSHEISNITYDLVLGEQINLHQRTRNPNYDVEVEMENFNRSPQDDKIFNF